MILVTGGAGYVGSHAVLALLEAGHEVAVLDDLSEGHEQAVPDGVELIRGNVGCRDTLAEVFGGGRFRAILHFAARCYVGESVAEPERYWQNNVGATSNLLAAAIRHGVESFVFSSSCAVYGHADDAPLEEGRPRRPISPYGRTKHVVELMLEDLDAAGKLRFAALRYFNAAGADPQGRIGEDHRPESHLLPLVLTEARVGGGRFTVFGTDYDTPDGTCVRDYIHVTDLAGAHVRALRHLLDGGASSTVNLGTGTGHSVLSVIREVERVTGRKVEYREGPRRPGDPARLVAAPGRAEELLGFRPAHSDLASLVETAWRWQREHPEGYER